MCIGGDCFQFCFEKTLAQHKHRYSSSELEKFCSQVMVDDLHSRKTKIPTSKKKSASYKEAPTKAKTLLKSQQWPMLFLVWKNEDMSQKQPKHLCLSLLVVQCLIRFHKHLLEYNTCAEDFEVSRRHIHNSKVFKVLKQGVYGHFFPRPELWK